MSLGKPGTWGHGGVDSALGSQMPQQGGGNACQWGQLKGLPDLAWLWASPGGGSAA